MMVQVKKIFRKTVKVFLWIVCSILILMIVLVIALRIPATQNYLIQKVVSYISNKTHTVVTLGEINVSFPKSIVLKDLSLEDVKKDKLLYAHRAEMDIDMWKLLSTEIKVNHFQLEDATTNIYRSYADSFFNYQFLIDAFVSKGPAITKSSWKFSIADISLLKTKFTFNDETVKSKMNFNIGELQTGFEAFDTDKSIYHLKNISLKNSIVSIIDSSIVSTPTVTTDTSSATVNYDFSLKNLDAANVNLLYETIQQKMKMQIGDASIAANKIDITQQNIKLEKFTLNNSKIYFAFNKHITTDTIIQKSTAAVTPSVKPWMFSLSKLNWKANEIAYDDFNAQEISRGIDFNHISLSELDADIDNLFDNGNEITASVHELKANDKSGFSLKHFESNLTYDSTHLELAALDIQANQSRIRNYFSIAYPSLSAFQNSIGEINVNADLINSTIALNDFAFFQPAIVDSLPVRSNQVFYISSKITGAVKDIHINSLQLNAGSNTSVSATMNIKGLPEIDNTYFDITLNKLSTTDSDVQSILKAGTIPDTSIALPPEILLSGYFRGSLNQFSTKGNLQSSFGNMSAVVDVTPNDVYNASVNTDHFDFGKLMLQPDTLLGTVTLEANLAGKGFSSDSMQGIAAIKVQQAFLNNYNYHNILVNGNYTSSQFDGTASVNDSNLIMNYAGILNFDSLHSQYKFLVDIQSVDLQALHFTTSDIRMKAELISDMKGNSLNNLTGTFDLRNMVIIKNDTLYTIDSALFVSISASAKKIIHIQSPFLVGDLQGDIALGDLSASLTQHFNRYFNSSDTSMPAETALQNFTFDLEMQSSELYTVLVPSLQKFVPGKISGAFNNSIHKLNFDANIPEVKYSNMEADSLIFSFQSDATALTYNAGFSTMYVGKNKIINTSVYGKALNDSLSINLGMKDENNMQQYLFAGSIAKVYGDYRLHFQHDGILLNYQSWNIAPDNYLVLSTGNFNAHNLSLVHGSQALKISSTDKNANAPLEISFKEFEIEDLSHIIRDTANVVGGMIEGTLALKNLQTSAAFNANLVVSNFTFLNDTLGTITLTSDNETVNRYNVNAGVKGNGNNLTLKGYYSTLPNTSSLHFDADVINLNLASIEAYTLGQVTNLTGNVNGKLQVGGSTVTPLINGEMNVDTAGFNFTYLNSYFKIENENLVFDNNRLLVQDFALLDSLNNAAIINGWIEPLTSPSIAFDLKIKTENFMAVNSVKTDTSLFYGKVIVDSYTSVTGNADFPKIEVKAKLKEGSALTVAVLDDKIATIESDGIVIFNSSSDSLNNIMTKTKIPSVVVPEQFKGLELNAAIEVNKNSSLTIITDPASGDSLMVKGTATLNYTIDPSGKTSLTGRYEISEGVYQLSFYDFIKRKFILSPGSSIIWNGDPYEAELNLDAVYQLKTSPIDLLQSQVAGLSPEQQNTYRQQLLFLLNMHMSGSLLQPIISFSIDVPEKDRGELGGVVYAKLNQLNQEESALNKQVFALLVLNRFVADDPLQTAQTFGPQDLARNSVSQLLTQQLNRFAGNYLKDIVSLDLNLNSYEDYSTGTAQGRTQLNILASKDLFRNRLNVQAGGNVDLEGARAKQNSVSNFAGDLSAEYKITPAGTLRLRVYRRNNYDVLEGQIVETALGLLFIRDFDRLRDIFIGDKKLGYDIPSK